MTDIQIDDNKSKNPDIGRCIYHNEDIEYICKQCQKQKYYCQQCKPNHINHKKYLKIQYINDLIKKLQNIQPHDQNIKKQIYQKIIPFINTINHLKIKMESAIHAIKLLSIQQCYLYYFSLTCTPGDLYTNLCKCKLSQNRERVQKAINELNDMKIDSKIFSKQIPQYTLKLKKQIDSLSQCIETVTSQAKRIRSSFNLSQLSKKIQQLNNKSLKNTQNITQADLKSLSFYNKNYFPMQIVQQIKKQKPQTISNLNLQNNLLNTFDLKLILINNNIHFPNLLKLNLSNNNLDQKSLDILLQSHLPKLQSINLSGNKMEFTTVSNRIRQKWPRILEEIYE